jgi:hypothetical protein
VRLLCLWTRAHLMTTGLTFRSAGCGQRHRLSRRGEEPVRPGRCQKRLTTDQNVLF